MADRAQLLALQEMLRVVKGPDRELDAQLARAFDLPACEPPDCHPALFEQIINRVAATGVRDPDVRDYTASIDAALALVERMLPEWEWHLTPGYAAVVNPVNRARSDEPWNEDHEVHEGRAPTVPLAILSALIAALLSQTEPVATADPVGFDPDDEDHE